MFPSNNFINPSLHSFQTICFPFHPFPPQNVNNNIFLPQQNHEIFPNPKKRTKRKDRHSKIYTAHGLRDRRVRLSVDIASKFFKLQDILGFDKASQTISWLLKNSEPSIKELNQKQSLNHDGFENISPISELSEGGASERNNFVKSKETKVNRQESRARARARARERTRGKIMCTQKIDELNHSISSRSNNLIGEIESCEGMGDDVTKGSPSNPKFGNPISTHKDWGKNLFTGTALCAQLFSKFIFLILLTTLNSLLYSLCA